MTTTTTTTTAPMTLAAAIEIAEDAGYFDYADEIECWHDEGELAEMSAAEIVSRIEDCEDEARFDRQRHGY